MKTFEEFKEAMPEGWRASRSPSGLFQATLFQSDPLGRDSRDKVIQLEGKDPSEVYFVMAIYRHLLRFDHVYQCVQFSTPWRFADDLPPLMAEWL